MSVEAEQHCFDRLADAFRDDVVEDRMDRLGRQWSVAVPFLLTPLALFSLDGFDLSAFCGRESFIGVV